MNIEYAIGAKLDSAGRRIPVFRVIDEHDNVLLRVSVYANVVEVVDCDDIPRAAFHEIITHLLQFAKDADELGLAPPPSEGSARLVGQHAPGIAKKQKTKAPRTPRTPKPPHPSHYPKEVFEGQPPPPPPGGWPKGAGIWEERSSTRDEYGPIGGILTLPDQPGGVEWKE
ncbi:MAG: hypothetical protein COW29_08920 [Rhodobacterales bacterium CG15_BIG_FIL_POST_REV_8_21_14_020_59_13]|nr:MAG: hypothetical protein COW29_08920 [Rhodobacterales bacterium CG15_BIG_FIL_POST_REV_8_21_14_020_59_13]